MKKFLALILSVLIALPACAEAPSKIVKIENNSTVLLHVKFHKLHTDKEGWGTCSGVYVKNNLILSASHCVVTPKNVEITQIWVSKDNESERAVVVKIDMYKDLLLLYTPMKGKPIKLARSVHQGEKCFAIGNPLGMDKVITEGIISKDDLRVENKFLNYLLIDAVVLPGNSGGALLNRQGKLIGIVVMTTSMLGSFGASGLGIAVSIKDIREFLRK